ncbi:hypothetical protein V499_06847 [Pseudogymnoascus sp. VKM F-103]|uniref:Protein phosphatase methylesterase 1 n=1 Tax=Pseudogymnoascus verrucosus TaxID=342668 RepID=A0A1B8GD18_9PEZI|nr:Protein with carboxyl methyl esterase activity [Pseudogymnoascus verrucosus]KFY73029.1 hypothetical protein V499_06847 [Pseudogymnoascus sp. VKM F-103]OBT93728.1 Protein with carboxyl methyl esterase activity [Pseudogymnoascus verrucosus]
MSELQRAFAKAKLAGLPPVLPEPLVDLDEQGEERDAFPELSTERSDDDSSSASSASSASSTGTIRPTSSGRLFARPMGSPNRSPAHFAPLPWTSYFERDLKISHIDSNLKVTHQVYLTSPLSSPTKPGPLFVTHHGAGSSGLTFATLAKSIRALLPNAGILSLDARGHGSTTIETLNESDPMDGILDVSLDTLTDDLVTVIQKTKEAMNWPTMPPIILIGHSLGGSVVTSVAARGTLGPSLLCYAVLDIVERTAIESLASMAGYLKSRPATFPSLEAGIAWHVRTGSLKNVESARVSVPPLLTLLYNKPKDDANSTAARQIYNWRSDLASTEPFWNGWFVGLSDRFLSSRGGKLLILAGTERLDKEMMIGQMQGKYALQIFPDAGHFLHEDQPEKTAQSIVDFYKRNDRSAMVLPPKVSDMLQQGKKV